MSLYYNLTSNNKSVAWYLSDILHDPRERTQTDGIANAPYRFQDDYEASPAEI